MRASPSFAARHWAASTERLEAGCSSAVVVEERESLNPSLANFPVRFLSRQLSSHKLGSVWIAFPSTAPPYECLYLARYLPSPSLPGRRGVRGDGRDHYITKHPQAIVLSNCHTTLPQCSLQASGQVLCATAQTRGRREIKKVKGKERQRQRRRGRGSHETDEKEKRKWEIRKLREKRNEAALFVPRVQITTIFMQKILDICVSVTQIMFAGTWKKIA